MKLLQRFKSLPIFTKRLLSLGVVLGLFVALPLLIWAIVTQTFLFRQKAATGEPGVCIAVNKTIVVTPDSDLNGTCHNIQAAVNAVDGSGYNILIKPGTYNPPGTININGKNNLTITGDEQAGNGAAVINFVPGGWGFLIQNSSGSIQWLTIQGGSSNGMMSIQNSHNFGVGYARINSQTSHTLDVQGSSEVSIYNSDIQSSAGAVEIVNSSNINVLNSQIHDSANGIAANNSTHVTLIGNLITNNRESGIEAQNVSNMGMYHNTIVGNSTNSILPAINLSGNIIDLNFMDNLVVFNNSTGIKYSGSNFTRTFGHNDVYQNAGGNYIGFDSYTGINGNISLDPLIHYYSPLSMCLNNNSPAIYGNVANGEYMGYVGPCGVIPPSPSPTPLPFINLTSPNGGETLVTGDTAQITWNSSPNISTVNINYYNNATSNTVATNVPNTGVFNWIVPAVPSGASNQFKIQISAYPGIYIEDYSQNYFYIVAINPTTSPSPTPTSNPVPGDVNSDGIVNIVDIGIIIDNYRLDPPQNPEADLNHDGIINIIDIGIVVDNYQF